MRALILFACLLWASTAGEAATLYVNPSGSPACSDATNKASNSAASPWCTIGRAAWGNASRGSPSAGEAAAAGDTVLVTGATYLYNATQCGTSPTSGPTTCNRNAIYLPTNNGASGNPITFQCVGTCTLQSPTYYGPVIGCWNTDYITWTGAFFLDEANIGIQADTGTTTLFNSTGCVVNGVTIDGNGAPAYIDNHTGIRVEHCESCVITNNTIHDVLHASGNLNGAGVQLYDSNDTLIEHNYIYDNGAGVAVKGITSGTQLRTIVRYNVLAGNDVYGVFVEGSRESRVYQNVIRDGFSGIGIISQGPLTDDHPVDDTIYNNTVYSMSAVCVQVTGATWESVRVWNNICSTTANMWNSANVAMPSTTSIDAEHNVYFGNSGNFYTGSPANKATLAAWRTDFGQDDVAPDSVSSNPLLVNTGALDFRICTGVNTPATGCSGASPAINLGVNVDTAVATNAGAFITNLECIGLESECTEAATIYRIRVTPP